MRRSARRTKCRIANVWKPGSGNKPASLDYSLLPYNSTKFLRRSTLKPFIELQSVAPHVGMSGRAIFNPSTSSAWSVRLAGLPVCRWCLWLSSFSVCRPLDKWAGFTPALRCSSARGRSIFELPQPQPHAAYPLSPEALQAKPYRQLFQTIRL
jgi:hypothetical protein